MDKDTLLLRAQHIWNTGGYRYYAAQKIQEWLNLNNSKQGKFTPLSIFAVIEWAAANLSSNLFLKTEWFYIEGDQYLTDRLYNNLKLIDWDTKVKKLIKAFFITGAFVMPRYKPIYREKQETKIVNPQELQDLQNHPDVEILEKKKVSKEPELYKVAYKKIINRLLVDIEVLNPTRIEFSADMQEFVRLVYLSEEEAKKYNRRVWQTYKEQETGYMPYYMPALEYYKDNKLYLIVNNEILYEAALPTDKSPIVYISPIQTLTSPLGFTLVDILKDLQNFETDLQRAFIENVKDLADYKVIYNPTAVNKNDLTQDKRLIQMKNPDIAPNQAVMFVPKAQNVIPFLAPAIEFLKGEQENLSGFTRYNMGLEGKSLNKTATGITLLMQAGQFRLKDYLQRLLLGLHKLLVNVCVYMGADREISLKIKEEALPVVKQEKLQKILQLVQLSPQAFNPYKLVQKAAQLIDIDSEIKDILATSETVNIIEGENNGGIQ